ncbi:Sugar phosphate isomerase/epimerase [Lachnospiraceae bacterium NLAE-zl-G231]|nr:Sugar phosphate isomerase/epimerase [Lachnospiraceae bacterium NLAE-zl-G231]
MQIGCALLNPEDMIKAQNAGYNYVEFMGKYLTALSEKEYSSIQRQAERLCLPVLGINGYCPPDVKMIGPGFNPEKVRKYAACCAVRAGGLGVRFVGIGSPKSRMLPSGYSTLTAEKELKEFLRITTEEFDKYGIRVCLEPLAICYCNFINTLSEAVSVVKELQLSNLGIVIDFYNMEYVGEADMDLRTYVDCIYHAHISEDEGEPEKRSYLKPEKAGVYQNRICGLLAAGYRGMLTLEIDCVVEEERAKESLELMRRGIDVHKG